jgi:shikimate kinase
MVASTNTKIFLIGPMGVGKTTIGRGLANKLSYDFYDVDHIIEERAGADIAWIYDLEGPEGFRKREEHVIDEFTQKNRIVLATGGGAVLSPLCRSNLSGRGFVVYLTAPLEKLHQRTEFDKKRPQLQTDEKYQVMEDILEASMPYYEELADLTVRTDKTPISKIIQIIFDNVVKI